MRAICVDDEAILLRALTSVVEQSSDINSVASFSNGKAAIEYAKENPIDIAFLDIEIRQMTGIELAVELRKIHPKLFVVFCTGYDQYALDAFKIHANGYLTKPIYTEDVQEQIDNIKVLIGEDSDKLVVKCFGNFEVYHNNKPVEFKRNKSKELLAYLIDRNGATASVIQIADSLWEDELDEKKIKNNLYQAYHQLKNTLETIGFSNVLIKNTNGYAVNTKLVDCDYYKYLNKEISIDDISQKEYMIQYSWAEETNGLFSR